MQQVLVLNASFEPLNVCSLRRAHVLVFKGKAEVVEELDRPLCSATARFPWPHVIRLLSYVRVPRIVQRKISRRALFARDGWRCVYCGTSSGRLTLDHVIPRSRGGDSVWENVVTSCAPCNLRKGNRLLHEVQMELPPPAAPARAGALHPARGAEDPGALGAVPRRVRRLRRPPPERSASRGLHLARNVGLGVTTREIRWIVSRRAAGRRSAGCPRRRACASLWSSGLAGAATSPEAVTADRAVFRARKR